MKKLMTMFVVSVAFAGVASAQALSDTTSGTASATVIEPIAVANVDGLLFGSFSVDSGTGGTVSIAVDGVRSSASASIGLATSTVGAAHFDVTGQASTTYAYSVDPTATLTNGTPAENMTATLLSDSLSGDDDSGTLDGSGDDSIVVYGSLAVAAGQPAGPYSGDFDVTVTYN